MWPQLFGGLGGEAGDGLADRQPLAARNERHQAARTALIRDRSTKSRCDSVGRLSHHTGQAVIVALRRAQRPVWAPGVRILGRPPIIRRRSRTSSIVDRAPIAWVRWGGPTERRRSPHRSPGLRGVAGCPSPAAIAEQLHAQHGRVQAGPCQPSMGVVGRSVGEAAWHSSSGRPPGRRRWRHSRNWRHSSKFTNSVNELARGTWEPAKSSALA